MVNDFMEKPRTLTGRRCKIFADKFRLRISQERDISELFEELSKISGHADFRQLHGSDNADVTHLDSGLFTFVALLKHVLDSDVLIDDEGKSLFSRLCVMTHNLARSSDPQIAPHKKFILEVEKTIEEVKSRSARARS